MGWFSFHKKQQNVKIKRHKAVKFGVAFGGGGARGICHIGVIRAFEEWGIVPDFIAGTSAGSLVGALYACGYTSEQMIEIIKTSKIKEFKNSSNILFPSKSSNIELKLSSIIGTSRMFSELEIPFTAVCTNIKTGRECDIASGDVSKAVAGSCAVPALFTPVEFDKDRTLVDGGLKNNLPADVVRKMGADVVIAVDVNHLRGKGTDKTKITSILKSTLGVLIDSNVQYKKEYADICILPDTENFKFSNMDDYEKMIMAGYNSAICMKTEIEKLLSTKLKKQRKKLWQTLLQRNQD
ncbi:MAG: patatin-like phospholipase family protein [Clostridia bacterium]